MLKDKTVVLGVTGSIASYKIANLTSMLVKQGCDVHVIMTKNATNFINPITFETLTNNKCIIDTFDRNFQFHVSHVSLAKKCDCMMIAPASANIIGKVTNGIADDMLSTTIMACKSPVMFAPTMNTAMYENPIVQDNMKKLKSYGYEIIEADSGYLACGDTGKGKMPSEEVLYNHIRKSIECQKDLSGKKILVTAGATQEAIDPVRFISNHSTGKMGYAIAERCMLHGADVTLISGFATATPPPFVDLIKVTSAEDMFQAVTKDFHKYDIIIKSSAVSDYTPLSVANHKIKKSDNDMSIPLKRTKDILAYLGANKVNTQYICGFSMETENLIENSKTKLKKKNIDMIVANNLTQSGAGFGVDTNIVTIITPTEEVQLPLMSKSEVAENIVQQILKNFSK
ncbi:MAG: bifunctional phosphopantothenoylcysteine decarboxylase/phosphopantothenate--cysteine ligase CoaBC [Oscillospiraceae bacterium]